MKSAKHLAEGKTIRLRRTSEGDYVTHGSDGIDGSCQVYTGEDAKILDMLFKHAERNRE